MPSDIADGKVKMCPPLRLQVSFHRSHGYMMLMCMVLLYLVGHYIESTDHINICICHTEMDLSDNDCKGSLLVGRHQIVGVNGGRLPIKWV